jgi:hypothetical protein
MADARRFLPGREDGVSCTGGRGGEMQGQMYTGSCACVLHCVIVMAGLQGLEHMCMRTDGPMYKVDRNHKFTVSQDI